MSRRLEPNRMAAHGGSVCGIAFSDGTGGVLEISNQAVVTSGAMSGTLSEKMEPDMVISLTRLPGYPAESGLASAHVARKDDFAMRFPHPLYVMGRSRAIEYWQQHQNFDMILITEDGEIYLTDGVADRFTLDSYHSNMTVHVI